MRPVRLQPLVELHQWFSSQPVHPPLGVALDRHQPGVTQHLEMTGHSRLVHPGPARPGRSPSTRRPGPRPGSAGAPVRRSRRGPRAQLAPRKHTTRRIYVQPDIHARARPERPEQPHERGVRRGARRVRMASRGRGGQRHGHGATGSTSRATPLSPAATPRRSTAPSGGSSGRPRSAPASRRSRSTPGSGTPATTACPRCMAPSIASTRPNRRCMNLTKACRSTRPTGIARPGTRRASSPRWTTIASSRRP